MITLKRPTAVDKKKILIVDSDAGLRLLLASLLQSGSICIHEAADGEEAIRCLRDEGPFNLVLSDIDLPVMSGLGLMGEIRTQHPEVPVVFLTEDTEIDLYLTAMDEGAFDFLPKPVQLGDLLRTVERALSPEVHLPQPMYSMA